MTSAAEVIPLSVGEQAYQLISADILFGRMPPGARLRLDRMKAEYGVGIGTLREILSRLAAEGLVLAEGQRGFEVPPVDARRTCASSAGCGLLLERHALAQSFAAGDMEWEGRVVAAHHKLEVIEGRMIAGRRDGPGLEALRRRVPPGVDLGLRIAELMQAHASGFDRYLRYLMVAACFRGEIAANEHRRLRDLRARTGRRRCGAGARGTYRRLRRPCARRNALLTIRRAGRFGDRAKPSPRPPSPTIRICYRMDGQVISHNSFAMQFSR